MRVVFSLKKLDSKSLGGARTERGGMVVSCVIQGTVVYMQRKPAGATTQRKVGHDKGKQAAKFNLIHHFVLT